MFLGKKQTKTAWIALTAAVLAMASPVAAQTRTTTTRTRAASTPTSTATVGSGTRAARPASYGFDGARPSSYARPVSTASAHRSARMMPASMQEEMIIEDGGVYEEVSEHAGVRFQPGGCDDCGDCNSCGVGNCNSCADGCLVPCPQLTVRNMEFFVGVEGFKGPVNRGRDGSFGFNEGANLGCGLP